MAGGHKVEALSAISTSIENPQPRPTNGRISNFPHEKLTLYRNFQQSPIVNYYRLKTEVDPYMPAIKRLDYVPSDEFCPNVVSVPKPQKHYRYLNAPNGNWLGTEDGSTLCVKGYVDDAAIWDVVAGQYQHVVTGLKLNATNVELGNQCRLSLGDHSINEEGNPGDAADFTTNHGPEFLPSHYLDELKNQGWVSLACILSDEIVDGLQRVGCVDEYERQTPIRETPLAQDPSVAQVSAEPISLWLTREYMKTRDIRLGHSPGVSALTRDDGKREVQGWHTDFPYLWGTGDRIPVPSGDLVLGMQRNVCVSDFNRQNGATLFKLGSHSSNVAPPEEWGLSNHSYRKGFRATYGLPYGGEECDLIEAPAGSIVLYDARTWHRAGMNMTDRKRGAMIQAIVPGFIMPFMDTSHTVKRFLESDAYEKVTKRVAKEIESLMVHKIQGPGGLFAITTDRDLTERVREQYATAASVY